MNYLMIDTSVVSGIHVQCWKGEETKEITQPYQRGVSNDLLFLIQKCLHDTGLQPSDLQAIVCCSGPGGFTRIRVGVACANAMGYALQIPVVGFMTEEKQQMLEKQKKWSSIIKRKGFHGIIPKYDRDPV